MRDRFISALVFAVALMNFALPALAADLTGTWSGHITDPGGSKHDITLNLKLDGTKVSGTMTGGPPTGEEQKIVGGELEGDQLSFEVEAQGPGGESLKLPYKGKISGNRITGSQESPMGSLPWEATKK